MTVGYHQNRAAWRALEPLERNDEGRASHATGNLPASGSMTVGYHQNRAAWRALWPLSLNDVKSLWTTRWVPALRVLRPGVTFLVRARRRRCTCIKGSDLSDDMPFGKQTHNPERWITRLVGRWRTQQIARRHVNCRTHEHRRFERTLRSLDFQSRTTPGWGSAYWNHWARRVWCAAGPKLRARARACRRTTLFKTETRRRGQTRPPAPGLIQGEIPHTRTRAGSKKCRSLQTRARATAPRAVASENKLSDLRSGETTRWI